MKLKKGILSRCMSRALVLLVFFLFSFLAEAQVVSVVATDGVGTEVTPPDPADDISFTISKTAGPSLDTTVNYAITGGTATVGDDFIGLSGSVVLTDANPSQIVTLTNIIDDNIVEDNETVIIEISLPLLTTATLGVSQANAVIQDSDNGLVAFDTNPAVFFATVNEDGSLQLPIEFGQFRPIIDKPNSTASPLTVNYTIDGTATNTVDYNLTNAVTLTFSNNGTTTARNIRVAPTDDGFIEGNETVEITLVSTDNPRYSIGTPSTAIITIIDDECAVGEDAPMLNGNPTTLCDVATVDLNSYYSGVGTVSWSTVANPTEVQLLSGTAITAAGAGTYYALFTAGTGATFCSSDPTEITIVLNTSPSAGTATDDNRCNETGFGEPTSIDLDNTLNDQDAGGTWQLINAPIGETITIQPNNTVNFNDEPEGAYVFRYTVPGDAPCLPDTVDVTITVTGCDPCVAGNTPPTLANDAPETEYCRDASNNETITLDLDDFTNSNAPPGTELRWSTIDDVNNENAHLSSSIINISNGATYYGFFWDDVSECASDFLEIPILIKTIPELTVGEDQIRCGPGVVNLTASAMVGVSNATINWYTTPNGNVMAGTGQNFSPNLSQTTTYYVEATFNGCNTAPRIPVTATIVPQPSAGTPQNGGIASACSDADNGPTVLDLDDLISGEDEGVWTLTSAPDGESVNIPLNNIVDFEDKEDGDYVFTYTTTGAQTPCVNESSVITISINDCDVDSDLDGLFDGPEAILGTNPNNPDSDGDGINDGDEVGSDIENPLNEDGDGFIDALDSNIADADSDGVVDQIDPANENPCIPNTLNGICDSDEDGITDTDETANGSDPLDPCDPNPESDVCNAEVDLEVLKSVDNINALIGDTVVFTITVNNLSDGKASSVLIGDLLESGFEYVSHSPAEEQYDSNSGEWAIPLIDSNASKTLEITVTILESGVYSNTAELLDVFQTDTDASNNTSETITLPIELPEGIDLVLEKSALSANPLVGEEVIFTIKLTNASIDEAPVTSIEVEDLIADDSGFVYIDSNPASGSTYDENTGVWAIESLAKNQEIHLEIRVSVPNEGTFTNTAEIKRSSPSDSNPANNLATAEVKVSLPTPAEVGFLFNQFSPNGDGTNDILKINRRNQETNQEREIVYNIQIFNRYGNLVYEAINKRDSEVWDGTWKGKEVPDGTYFYTMSLDIGNGPEQKKGWIQLIR